MPDSARAEDDVAALRQHQVERRADTSCKSPAAAPKAQLRVHLLPNDAGLVTKSVPCVVHPRLSWEDFLDVCGSKLALRSAARRIFMVSTGDEAQSLHQLTSLIKDSESREGETIVISTGGPMQERRKAKQQKQYLLVRGGSVARVAALAVQAGGGAVSERSGGLERAREEGGKDERAG